MKKSLIAGAIMGLMLVGCGGDVPEGELIWEGIVYKNEKGNFVPSHNLGRFATYEECSVSAVEAMGQPDPHNPDIYECTIIVSATE